MTDDRHVDEVARSGDLGSLWKRCLPILRQWAKGHRKKWKYHDADELVSEASEKFLIAANRWDGKRSFLTYFGSVTKRHWTLISVRRFVRENHSAVLSRLPHDRRGAFGLPETPGQGSRAGIRDAGGFELDTRSNEGNIAMWHDRESYSDDNDAQVCDDLLAQLNAEDACIIREYMHQDSLRGGPGLGKAIGRARKILVGQDPR